MGVILLYILIILIAVVAIGFFVLSSNNRVGLNKSSATFKKDGFRRYTDEIEIIHLSDIHYFSSKLTDYGESFKSNIEKDDAKVVRYVEEIMDAFILEMVKKKPDIIIISGDLTYNGEKDSHEDLAKKLKILKNRGIQVLVIPGNHDIDNETSKKFFGDDELVAENISVDDFKRIYAEFGYADTEDIISRDKKSLSYIFNFKGVLNILMLDTSTGKNNQYITNSAYKWIDKNIKSIKRNNEGVISVTHQNILAHNKIFVSGYKITNSSKLVEIFNKNNIRLNLSGHMHLQHISEYDSVYDAAVGSISLYPNLYAEIKIDMRNSIAYQTRAVDVSFWTEMYGKTDPLLIDFEKTAKNYFIKCTEDQVSLAIRDLDLDKDEKKKMLDFMINTNLEYFSGTMSRNMDLTIEHEGYKLWQKYCEKTFMATYLNSIYTEKSNDYSKLVIK